MIQINTAPATLFLLLGLMTAPTMAQPKQAPARPAPGKHDPLIDAQLRVAFGKMDRDKDGFLDDSELARAFRGAAAKPAPQPSYDEKGNLVGGAAQSALKYPDQVYLLALDTDGDGKVSWAEFDAYGEAYAAQFKNMQRLNQQALRAAYARAQRQLAVRRNQNYSRYGRTRYYRPAYSPRGRIAVPQAHHIQGRRPVNYSPNARKVHRPVKRHR